MERVLSEERTAFLERDFYQGFVKTCGFKLDALERGWAQSSLEVTTAHSQQDDFVHAGVMATMADHTAGYAAFSVVSEDCRILTLEFKINFLRPAIGDRLICSAKVVKEGKKVLVADSEVFSHRDGEKKLAAKALVTLMAVPATALRTEVSSKR
jgi:uncharacterized protein (TIGR00369 family)